MRIYPHIKPSFLFFICCGLIFVPSLQTPSFADATVDEDTLNKLLIEKSRDELIALYSETNLRSYQQFENQESMTFNYEENDKLNAITIYLKDNHVNKWSLNDREEMAKQYLSEFASGNILHNYPKVRTALLNALQKLPLDVYLTVTERARPIIFIDYYTDGIAQYAGSMEFSMRETDPPTLDDGFFIIRLGDGLNDATDIEAIEGIVLHETAHRFLEHLRNTEKHPCEREIEANRLVKEWGYEEEYKKASEEFGAKTEGDSPCQEWLKQQKNKAEEK